MSNRSPFVDQVVDRLNQVAPVMARSMFGGYGLFIEGIMIGLIADDVLYFKVDEENRQDYLDIGSEQFTYDRKGTPARMSYYRIPTEIVHNIEQLVAWVDSAHAAAKRSKSKSKRSRKGKKLGKGDLPK
ncbi:TfoX/Sxy family protein [Acaryochloris sp. IP29b_bin.137]|uniref:TfoX/Sxy family protein n=1 Tax=Acaryochloris sp. IP29b_bin.137 TaxID=2969217 RepID=UPI002615821C|nr:TfoX/Sxy family protein [Acaryochloris sp. IP29b_bin.137]